MGRGETLALAAAVTWAFSVILFKRSERYSPQGMNLFKNLVAIVLLTVTLAVMGVGIDFERPAADWWALIASGVLGIAVADTVFFMALRRLGPGLLAVVECSYVPSVVLLSVLFLGEAVSWWFGLGALAVVGGVLVAIGEPVRGDAPPKRDRSVGAALGGLGIVTMAIGVVIAKPALERGELVEVSLIRLIAGVCGQLVWIGLVRSQRSALEVLKPSAAWRTLLPASILGSYVAMLLWLGGFKWADASVAAVLNQMATVFTIIFARIFLAEPLTPRRLIGAAAAVGGALVILLPPTLG